MSSSSPAPKLPIWIFLATDAVLLVAAAYIANRAPRPLPDTATLAVVACVLAGAIIGLVPLVAYYERQKNETLDERQRALEALARTIATSAEQISIAAGGLHEIAEIAQRNLKHAEQLPQKLQEKMAEFQAQLANASDTEKEELEKEVEELRASETERLQTTCDRIARTAGEFARLEASIEKQVDAANGAAARLSAALAAAAIKIEQTTAQARAPGGLVAEPGSAPAKRAEAESATAETKSADPITADASGATPATTSALKRARKPHRPETAADSAVAAPVDRGNEPAAAAHAGPAPAAVAARTEAVKPAAVEDRGSNHSAGAALGERGPQATAPAVAEAKPNVAASDLPPAHQPPATIAPAADAPPTASNGTSAPPVAAAPTTNGPADAAAAAAAKPARKRPPRKPDDEQPGLGLDLGDAEPGQGAPATVERVISSDGATRLIVTAYIGIGNRLFIRGNGPGLSWDKGVPLQFVSIGKWRWETNDASTPVQLKLLKNDVQESVGLGALTIDPGHQHEVTAAFN